MKKSDKPTVLALSLIVCLSEISFIAAMFLQFA